MLIGEDKNHIDLEFTRSKIKVTRVTFVLKNKNDFTPYLENFYHTAFIFPMLIGFGEIMTCIYFGSTY